MIVVFGSVNLDLVARVPRLPAAGETLPGRSFAFVPGGKGANQALAARRAGADVALWGVVGDDAFAGLALDRLHADGVDLGGVRTVAAPTGVALIHVDDRGENAITVVAGANALARASAVPEEALAAASTLVLQFEVPVDEVLEMARRGRAAGLRIVMNPAPVAACPRTLLDRVDVLVVNETEAAQLASAWALAGDASACARELATAHGIAVVLTLGGRGALALLPDGGLRVPPLPVTAVDTVGAGDAFVGVLAAALDRALPWPRALAEAAAAGGLACTRAGAQDALPLHEEIARAAATLESRIERLRPGA